MIDQLIVKFDTFFAVVIPDISILSFTLFNVGVISVPVYSKVSLTRVTFSSCAFLMLNSTLYVPT